MHAQRPSISRLAARRLRRSIGCSVAALAVSGCVVGPDFKAPLAPDVALTAKPLVAPVAAGGDTQKFVAGLDIPGEWWELFHSRPLNTLVERALRDNHDLAAAQAAIRIAYANVEAERGMFFPRVDASHNSTRAKFASGDVSSPVNSPNPYYTLHTKQISVAYAPDVFGGTRRQVEQLRAVEDGQRFQLEATFLTLTSNLALAAVQEASLRDQIRTTERIVALQKELLGLLKTQLTLGQITELDVATQEAALAQSEQTLPPLQKQLSINRDLLIALTGHFAGEGLTETFDFKSLSLPRNLPVSLPSAVIMQRPDIRAAEANVHAASALIGVAIANRLPQFAITGNAGRQAEQFYNLFNASPAYAFWTIAGTATQVLFDGFTLEQKQRAAEAGFQQALEQYRSTVVVAFQNVADALQALQYDARTLRAAQAYETAADKALKLTRTQLELGQISSLQVLTAQQTYAQALLAVVQAKASRYTDTIALFQALGGGWWNRQDLDPAPPRPWLVRTIASLSDKPRN